MRVLGVLGLGAALCSSLVPHAGAVPTLAPPRGAPSPDIPLSGEPPKPGHASDATLACL